MNRNHPTSRGCRVTEPIFARIDANDAELGVCRFADGAVVLVAQATHGTVMVPLSPAQAERLADALRGQP